MRNDDTIMGSLQSKTEQEEHNCINAIAIPIQSIVLAHFCVKTTEDTLQIGLNIIMDARQRQERTREIHPITWHEQRSMNRRLIPRIQAIEQAEHQPVCQPTLRAIERLAWCMFEHENLRDGTFRHERRSQNLELARRGRMEPTRPAPRSLVRLAFDNG